MNQESHTIQVLLDTGNEAVSIVSSRWIAYHDLTPNKTTDTKNIKYAGTEQGVVLNQSLEIKLKLVSPITSTSETGVVTSYVMNTKDDMILSYEDIRMNFLKTMVETIVQSSLRGTERALDLLEGVAAVEVAEELEQFYNAQPNKALNTLEPSEGEVILPTFDEILVAKEEDVVGPSNMFGQVAEDCEQAKYNQRLQDYRENYRKAFSVTMYSELREDIRQLMESDIAINTFTFKTWKGVNMEPIKLKFEGLPSYLKQQARVIPHELKIPVQEALNKYVDLGLLVLDNRCSYGAGLVAVRKPDGTARICGDYRMVNQFLAGIPYEMPNIAETIELMRGFTIFAELDWTTAFRQLPLDSISAERLAVTTPWGIYKPLFVPEGITCGSALLMQHAYSVFQDMVGFVAPVHDNILVGATDYKDLMTKLKLLFARCAEKNIQLKIQKSNIGLRRIKFFGYIIAEQKYYIDPARIKALELIDFPNTRKKVLSFLGVLTFISPFIPNYADRMKLIFEMSKKDFSFDPGTWGNIDYKKAFEQAKIHATEACSLYFPDRTLDWTLRTDASGVGVGAVLVQAMPLGRPSQKERSKAKELDLVYERGDISYVEVPIAFTAKILSPQAQKWSVTEQELFAIVHAFKKLERLLRLKPFILQTDHNNLVTLRTGTLATSPKCVRWRQWMAQFPFILEHIKGKHNRMADFISRHLYGEEIQPEPMVATLEVEGSSQGRRNDFENMEEAIAQVHDAIGHHRGAEATWMELQRIYAPKCPISYQMVKDYVRECGICRKFRTRPEVLTTLNKAIPLKEPRSVVHVDVLKLDTDKLGNTYLFVFVNALTKYTLLYPAPTKRPEEFADALLVYMATVGLCDIIVADQGSEFTAHTSRILTEHLGPRLQYTLVGRPQANAFVERVNQEVLKELRILMLNPNLRHRWSHQTSICLVQLLLNTRKRTASGFSPIDLTFGKGEERYFPDPLKLRQGEREEESKALYRFNEHLRIIQTSHKEALEKIKKKQPDIVVYYNKGDLVLRKGSKTTKHRFQDLKLQPPKKGPYIVIKQLEADDGQPSNTVVCKGVNDEEQQSFHHETLEIFPGTLEEAKELQKIDQFEETIESIMAHKGNISSRTEVSYLTCFSDGDKKWLPYNVVKETQAVEMYWKLFLWSKDMNMTLEAVSLKKGLMNPKKNETLKSAIERIVYAPNRPSIGENKYISIYVFNNPKWDITEEDMDLFLNRQTSIEPLLRIKVSDIQEKTLEIAFLDMKYLHRKREVIFKRNIDLYSYMKYSVHTIEGRNQILWDEEKLTSSNFLDILYKGNNLTKTVTKSRHKRNLARLELRDKRVTWRDVDPDVQWDSEVQYESSDTWDGAYDDDYEDLRWFEAMKNGRK